MKDSFYGKGGNLSRQLSGSRLVNDRKRFKLALRHMSNRQLIAQFNHSQDPWSKRQIQIETKRRLKKGGS